MYRDNRLDFIRCVMNYMIVCLHSWAAFQYVKWNTLEYTCWTFVLSHLCALALPTFFLISGYLFFSGFSLKVWPEKLKRRVKRLAVPYVCWNVLFVVFYLAMAKCVPRLSARVTMFGLDTFQGAFSKVFSLTVHPIDGPLWFLRTLMIFVVVSPLLWMLLRVLKGWLALGLAAAWMALSSGCSSDLMMGVVAAYPPYSLFCFLLGGFVAMRDKEIVDVFSSWRWLVLGLSACCVRAYFQMGESKLPFGIEEFLFAAEAPALLSLVAHCEVKGMMENRVYRTLKEMSFFAYAGHFLFCSMLLHTIAPFLSFMTTGKFSLLVFIFCIPGTLLLWAVYAVGKRLFPKILPAFDGTL